MPQNSQMDYRILYYQERHKNKMLRDELNRANNILANLEPTRELEIAKAFLKQTRAQCFQSSSKLMAMEKEISKQAAKIELLKALNEKLKDTLAKTLLEAQNSRAALNQLEKEFCEFKAVNAKNFSTIYEQHKALEIEANFMKIYLTDKLRKEFAAASYLHEKTALKTKAIGVISLFSDIFKSK